MVVFAVLLVAAQAGVITAPLAGPVVYAAPGPANALGPVLKAETAAQLLGVAYSAAPAVAHMQYTNPIGISYAY